MIVVLIALAEETIFRCGWGGGGPSQVNECVVIMQRIISNVARKNWGGGGGGGEAWPSWPPVSDTYADFLPHSISESRDF